MISLVYGTAQAQPAFQLSGKVTDSAGKALVYATVQFVAGEDTALTLTGEDGVFSFHNLVIRTFHLDISMKGYLSFGRSFAVEESLTLVELGQIILQPKYIQLAPVTVSQIRPITMEEDTVSYHVAAFPVRDGAEVEDILKRLPGIEVDGDGNVIVQGKKIGRVLVNGKDFFDGDVLLAIRNLPADAVDKLQVIDDYGDKARLTGIKSGDAAKVLNIVLKVDKRNGDILHGEAGGGNGDRYLGDAFGNSFKGERQLSAAVNANNNSNIGDIHIRNGRFNDANQWDKHWGGSIYVNAGGIDSNLTSSLLQDNFYPGEQLRQYQTTQTKGDYTNDSLKAVITYKPDGNSLLRLTPTARLQQSLDHVTDSFSTLQQDSGFSWATTGLSQNKSQVTIRSTGGDLYFERLSPHSSRRFSVEVILYYKDIRQAADNLTNTRVVTDSADNSLTHYLVSNDVSYWHVNASANYYLPTGTSSFLELGCAEQSDLSRTSRLTQEPVPGGSPAVTIDSLSQDIFFRTQSQQWHAGYSAHTGRLQFSLELDLQPGILEGTADAKGDLTAYHFLSWLPLAQANWTLSSRRKLSFGYRGSSSLPTLQQVSPVTDLTNPQYPVTGNPGLNPSFTQAYTLHYEESALEAIRFLGYGVGIGYSTTRDPIIPYTIHPEDSSGVIQRTTYVNAGSASNVKADYHLTLPAMLDKRFRIGISGILSWSQNVTMADSFRYANIKWNWNHWIYLQWMTPGVFEANISGNYSVSKAMYPGSESLPSTFQAAIIGIQIKHYICQHWILSYWLGEQYTSIGGKFVTAPAFLTAGLQREFLAHNKATISLTGYNLLNSGNNIIQTSSTTGVMQAQTGFAGRYFLVTFQLKLSQFRK